jgi:hypothetical protein
MLQRGLFSSGIDNRDDIDRVLGGSNPIPFGGTVTDVPTPANPPPSKLGGGSQIINLIPETPSASTFNLSDLNRSQVGGAGGRVQNTIDTRADFQPKYWIYAAAIALFIYLWKG